MTVKELKEYLNSTDRYDGNTVSICVNTPGGYVCPDGAIVDVESVHLCGIDWHSHDMLIVPKNKLNVDNVENWSKGNSDRITEDESRKMAMETLNGNK